MAILVAKGKALIKLVLCKDKAQLEVSSLLNINKLEKDQMIFKAKGLLILKYKERKLRGKRKN